MTPAVGSRVQVVTPHGVRSGVVRDLDEAGFVVLDLDPLGGDHARGEYLALRVALELLLPDEADDPVLRPGPTSGRTSSS
jgi:hypothetical protein